VKKNSLMSTLLAAGAVVGATAFLTSAASADVACNQYGDCWHVTKHYTLYPKDIGVTFYPDTWREEHMKDAHYRWYDRDDDSGYYIRGEWHAFDSDGDHDGD